MKMNELIADLQKISDQRGNPEICFQDVNDWRSHRQGLTLVDWSRTSRGGKQRDMIHLLEEQEMPACTSIYGLCE